MTVPEIDVLHNSYIDCSQHFRAAWTHHQFLQGLRKMFLQDGIDPSQVDFGDIYKQLQHVSENLNVGAREELHADIEGIRAGLAEVTRQLVEQDSKISPSHLRQFFARVKRSDEGVLRQLLRFYLYAEAGQTWHPDRLDKADFLVTQIATNTCGAALLHDRAHLQEIFQNLWSASGAEVEDADQVPRRLKEMERIRAELAEVDAFEHLEQAKLVEQHRNFKHGLGSLFFHPEILLAVVETNVRFSEVIRRLHGQEERVIFAEYERLSEMARKGTIDSSQDDELHKFFRSVESYEEQMQQGVRLSDLSQLRSRAKSLAPQYGESRRPAEAGSEADSELEEAATSSSVVGGSAEDLPVLERQDFFSDEYEELIKVLQKTDSQLSPKTVALSQEFYGYGLEAREVVAFRRLDSGSTSELESFILSSAALRRHLNKLAAELNAYLEQARDTQEGPLFERGRLATCTADAFVHRFDHLVHQAILGRAFSDASDFLVLRMRTLRTYSGLWLLLHSGRHEGDETDN